MLQDVSHDTLLHKEDAPEGGGGGGGGPCATTLCPLLLVTAAVELVQKDLLEVIEARVAGGNRRPELPSQRQAHSWWPDLLHGVAGRQPATSGSFFHAAHTQEGDRCVLRLFPADQQDAEGLVPVLQAG